MANAQSEPSMDEILASIRRIISEEDDTSPAQDKIEASGAEPQDPLQLDEDSAVEPDSSLDSDEHDPAALSVDETANEAPQTPEPTAETTTAEEQTVTPFPAADNFDGVGGNVETTSLAQPSQQAPTPEQAPGPSVQDAPSAPSGSLASQIADGLLSQGSASQAAEAFGSLERNVRMSAGSARTIEDLVEAMLAPMIKGWLDDNLPRIVEEKVEEEVRRIARRG